MGMNGTEPGSDLRSSSAGFVGPPRDRRRLARGTLAAMRGSRVVAAVVLLALVAFLGWRTAGRPPADDAAPRAQRPGRAAPAPPAPPEATPDPTPSLSGAAQTPASPAPPAEPRGPRVVGRVVDAAGKAVAGARVVS